jgi:hypothetical protein
LAAAFVLAAALAAPLVERSIAILHSPHEHLHFSDSKEFLGSSAHAGFGVREAVNFLIAVARQEGPIVLLTDPIWGPPADAMFAFLNQRHGIQVYEAWWMQLSETYPIMPLHGRAELVKSHYERTKSGSLDLGQLKRVFYVTDTNYYPPEVVKIRQPTAQLLASFAKPNHHQAVTIYRLK